MNRIIIILFSFSIVSCNKMLFVNEKTSVIGSLNSYCLKDYAWDSLQSKYSINNIKNENFKFAYNEMKSHWTSPNYFLYFESSPEELIACEYYGVRIVYNPMLNSQLLTGMDDSLLTDKEQVRVRNRVINLLIPYSCDTGKVIFRNALKEPAIYGKDYYEKYAKWYDIF